MRVDDGAYLNSKQGPAHDETSCGSSTKNPKQSVEGNGEVDGSFTHNTSVTRNLGEKFYVKFYVKFSTRVSAEVARVLIFRSAALASAHALIHESPDPTRSASLQHPHLRVRELRGFGKLRGFRAVVTALKLGLCGFRATSFIFHSPLTTPSWLLAR